jgi:hypothetical protein
MSANHLQASKQPDNAFDGALISKAGTFFRLLNRSCSNRRRVPVWKFSVHHNKGWYGPSAVSQRGILAMFQGLERQKLRDIYHTSGLGPPSLMV